MKVLKPENQDYFSQSNGNLSIQKNGICELLKLKTYPLVIQFDSEEEVKSFAQKVLTCNI